MERVRHAEGTGLSPADVHMHPGSHSRVHCPGATDPFPPHVSLTALLQSVLLQGKVPQGPAEPGRIRTTLPQQTQVYLQLSTMPMDLRGFKPR